MAPARCLPTTRPPTDKDETQEGEGLRPAKAAALSSARCVAAKLQQPRLVRMQRKRELFQPRSHRVPEAPRVVFVLEADHDIIRVPQNDHVAFGFPPSPPIGPEIKDVVQVHVREQW